MEKSFENFKNYILINAKEKKACLYELEKAENCINFSQILEAIKYNANWCYINNLVNADILEKYVPDNELLSANIYVKKERIVQTDGLCFYYSSTSEHYDSSTSKHYGSSTSEHYDSSTSEHYDSSTSGSVYILKDTSIIHDQAIIRERLTNKVYFKKSAFEILEL